MANAIFSTQNSCSAPVRAHGVSEGGQEGGGGGGAGGGGLLSGGVGGLAVTLVSKTIETFFVCCSDLAMSDARSSGWLRAASSRERAS